MAPVFSRAAWKCVWHLIQVQLSSSLTILSKIILMIVNNNLLFGFIKCEWKVIAFNNLFTVANLLNLQNDLIHGWGLDMKLGYCAQVLICFMFLRDI
jgi:hypothetical protein